MQEIALLLFVAGAAYAQDFRYNQGARPTTPAEAAGGRAVAEAPKEPEPQKMFENVKGAFDAAPAGALTLGEIKKFGKHEGERDLLCYKNEKASKNFKAPFVDTSFVRDTGRFMWDIGVGATGDGAVPNGVGLGLERHYPPIDRVLRPWRGEMVVATKQDGSPVYQKKYGEHLGDKPPLAEPRNRFETTVTVEARKDARGNVLVHFRDHGGLDDLSMTTDIYCVGSVRPSDFFGK
jgi:hypothetical protein